MYFWLNSFISFSLIRNPFLINCGRYYRDRHIEKWFAVCILDSFYSQFVIINTIKQYIKQQRTIYTIPSSEITTKFITVLPGIHSTLQTLKRFTYLFNTREHYVTESSAKFTLQQCISMKSNFSFCSNFFVIYMLFCFHICQKL